MHEFYAMTESEQAATYQELAGQALQQWGITDARVELLKMRENAVFSVSCDRGSKYALRIHRAGYHSDAELRSELQWMQALTEFGVQTPAVIPTADGALFKTVTSPAIPEPRQVDLLAWVDGQAIGSIENGVEQAEGAVDNYRTVGRLVARMHQFASQWQRPVDFTRHAWDEAGLLGEEPWWGRFWELDALDSAQRVLVLRARDVAHTELAAYGRDDDRYGLIHADPLPENFLRDEAGTIRVIDFDDGGFGWWLFDFATALFFHLGEPGFDDLLAAMIAGYREVRDLPPEFKEKLPLFLLLRGFSYLGWAHTRRETDTARELTPELVTGVTALAEDFLGSFNQPSDALKYA
jgi:Ser/Thr protein kinase RdoA (MazF antagonist)